MTTIQRKWDPGLGRWRDPYAWELPPSLRSGLHGMSPREQARWRARDERRAGRDARIRARRAEQRQR